MHSQPLEPTKRLARTLPACSEQAFATFLMSSARQEQASGIFLAGSQGMEQASASFLAVSQSAEQASASFLARSKRAERIKKSFLGVSKCLERATKVIINDLKTRFHDPSLSQPSSIDECHTLSLLSYFGIDRFITLFGMTGALIILESGRVKTSSSLYAPAPYSPIKGVIPNEVRNLSVPGNGNPKNMRNLSKPGYRNINKMRNQLLSGNGNMNETRNLNLNYKRGKIKRENSIENANQITSVIH